MSEEKKVENEVNLIDYVNVILKRKKIIIFWFFILVIITAILSFFVLPKVYEVSTSIEIGRLRRETNSSPEKDIEDSISLNSKLERDVYGPKIRENLDLAESEWPEIKFENPEETHLIVMTIESLEKVIMN